MKLLALLVLGFSFPFLLTASNDLFGLRLTVLEDVEKLFYDIKIVSVIGEHETLFTLMSYTEDLKKTFLNHSDKTESELYEIAFKKFEEALKATGEFNKPHAMRIYTIFQNFIIGKSPVLREVEVLSKRSTSTDSLGSIDLDEFYGDICNSLPDDVLAVLNDSFLFPSVGSLLEAPSDIQPSSKRSYDADLAAKKWALAAKKLSRFHKKIYIFVKGLPDRSLSSKFFAATKINDNLKKSFNESAESQAPFYEQSIVDNFSLEVEKFVVTLDVEDQDIIYLFRASVMEIGSEIYKEIKDEFNEHEQEENEDIYAQEFKRKRMETTTFPINFSNLGYDFHNYFQNIAENFKIEDGQFSIPSRTETGNYSGDEEEKIEEDEEVLINIASPEELEQPETVSFLNDPFDNLQDIVITTNLQQFDGIRSIYYGLVDRDFQELGNEGQVLLGTVLDHALNRVFKRK